MTGVEGYMESAASGLVAAIGLSKRLTGESEPDLGEMTLLGALSKYVTVKQKDFQPMNANFGLLPPYEKRIRNKKERYEAIAQRSLHALADIINTQRL